MTILVIIGSLRQGSLNRRLAEAAAQNAPEGVTIDAVGIDGFPLYNSDLEIAYPQFAIDFKARVGNADGVIIVTPEYNYSIPGVLKNALDWLSRPPATQPFNGKPVGIMGASSGVFGTVRAQSHLRQVLQFLNARVMAKPELLVGQAQSKFDEGGALIDEGVKGQLAKYMQAFAVWVGK